MESQSYTNYSKSIQNLKKECLQAGINEPEFKKLYFNSLKSLEKEEKPMMRRIILFCKTYKVFLLMIMLALCTMYNFQYIYSSIVCSLQDYIYTGLRLLRKAFIPIISMFPSIVEYYHETCLIQNPFFTVVDMDCWPCSTVNNIREVMDPKPVTNQYIPPFTYKTDQERITLNDIEALYIANHQHDGMAYRTVLMNNQYRVFPTDIFKHNHVGDIKSFYIWKFQKMNEARMLRNVIPRPIVVPKFGQSTERFLIIDASQKSYFVPDTECSFAFMISLSGSRIIKLRPAKECQLQCKALKVELKESHLLWYNWWYWKPQVQISSANTTFIAHVGSYC